MNKVAWTILLAAICFTAYSIFTGTAKVGIHLQKHSRADVQSLWGHFYHSSGDEGAVTPAVDDLRDTEEDDFTGSPALESRVPSGNPARPPLTCSPDGVCEDGRPWKSDGTCYLARKIDGRVLARPTDCLPNGFCHQGRCHCVLAYSGPDCKMPRTLPSGLHSAFDGSFVLNKKHVLARGGIHFTTNPKASAVAASARRRKTHTVFAPLSLSLSVDRSVTAHFGTMRAHEMKAVITASLWAMLPEEDLLRGRVYNSCAIVGSSGISLVYREGEAIDAHDAVFRFNSAPTRVGVVKSSDGSPPVTIDFGAHVGRRTTFRLVNTQNVNFLEGKEIRIQQLQSRNGLYSYFQHRLESPSDARFYAFDTDFTGYVSSNLHVLPTGGYFAIMLALHRCAHLDVYGFHWRAGHAIPHHYFNEEVPLEGGASIHDYDAEYRSIKALALEGLVTLVHPCVPGCEAESGVRCHNCAAGSMCACGDNLPTPMALPGFCHARHNYTCFFRCPRGVLCVGGPFASRCPKSFNPHALGLACATLADIPPMFLSEEGLPAWARPGYVHTPLPKNASMEQIMAAQGLDLVDFLLAQGVAGTEGGAGTDAMAFVNAITGVGQQASMGGAGGGDVGVAAGGGALTSSSGAVQSLVSSQLARVGGPGVGAGPAGTGWGSSGGPSVLPLEELLEGGRVGRVAKSEPVCFQEVTVDGSRSVRVLQCGPHGYCGRGGRCVCVLAYTGPDCKQPRADLPTDGGGVLRMAFEGQLLLSQRHVRQNKGIAFTTNPKAGKQSHGKTHTLFAPLLEAVDAEKKMLRALNKSRAAADELKTVITPMMLALMPEQDPLAGAVFNTCAIVGSSGLSMIYADGPAIDAHDMVIRFNSAPTRPRAKNGVEAARDVAAHYGDHVGTRTTFRFVNTQHIGFVEGGEVRVQQMQSKNGLFRYLQERNARRHDKLFVFDTDFTGYVSSNIPVLPTGGYFAIFFGLQLCAHLDIYGFHFREGHSIPHHYFNAEVPLSGRESIHDYNAEYHNILVLARAGLITLAHPCVPGCQAESGVPCHSCAAGSMCACGDNLPTPMALPGFCHAHLNYTCFHKCPREVSCPGGPYASRCPKTWKTEGQPCASMDDVPSELIANPPEWARAGFVEKSGAGSKASVHGGGRRKGHGRKHSHGGGSSGGGNAAGATSVPATRWSQPAGSGVRADASQGLIRGQSLPLFGGGSVKDGFLSEASEEGEEGDEGEEGEEQGEYEWTEKAKPSEASEDDSDYEPED
eukprot:jgi/Mesvir1/11214/Mv03063-RA.1